MDFFTGGKIMDWFKCLDGFVSYKYTAFHYLLINGWESWIIVMFLSASLDSDGTHSLQKIHC